MPLPDERQGQSVANLIGRFEQQTKRQSVGGSPRSSSVISQNTGDSVKEEIKGKREWPPRTLYPKDNPPPPIIPTSSWTRLNVSIPSAPPVPVLPPDTSKADLLPLASTEDSKPLPALLLPIPSNQDPVSDAGQPSPQTPKAPPPPNPTARSPVSAGRTPTSKTQSPSQKPTQKPPVKTPVKTQPTTPAQPVRPQHTGQSTVSTTSVRRVKSKGPSTPAKTPTNATRPKTPTARPKTPSSGLFAPTAASLAKARNAELPLPVPTKKVTLSSAAAERLSKPTAASLSKARTPASLPATPARTKTAVKPKTKAAPATAKTEKEKDKTSPPASHTESEHTENGYSASAEPSGVEAEIADEIHDEHELREPEAVIIHSQPEYLHPGQEETDIAPSPSFPSHELPATDTHELEHDPDVPEEASSDLHHDTDANSQPDPEHHESPDGGKSHVYVGNEIEDIVNMLEGTPAVRERPHSAASIPDEEVHEIPDEE